MPGATLLEALALAAKAVVSRPASTVPAGDDPLRLDLPSLGAGDYPTADTVHVLASLYLAAELEQAGVVPVAELFASQRDGLDPRSMEAAAKLDDFATREPQWYDRAGRVQLYARLFGLGPGATNDTGSLTNREFTTLLASLCRALAVFAQLSAGAGAVAGLEARVQEAAEAVLVNLSSRTLGNTLLAARRIEDQLRHAIELLRDPDICALVGARTLQQTIVNVLGDGAPDVQRLIDAGTNGQQVLAWLGNALPRLSSEGSPVMLLNDPVAVAAATWLRSVGVDTPQVQAAA